jgi:hypothetical protein
MPHAKLYQHFVGRLAALIGSALALIAGVNIAFDATGIWDTPIRRGFNANKAQQHLYERTAKAHMVMRLKPRAIILGSSRARLALSPKAFQAITGRPAYNLAIGSPHISELEAYFRHALFNQPGLKDVVLVVELQEFGPRSIATLQAQDFQADRLETGCLPLRDYAAHTLTFTALVDSFKTLQANQREPDVRPYGPDGEDLALPWRHSLASGGPVQTFAYYMAMPQERYTYDPTSMQSLANMVATCRARGIRLEVLTSPVHVVEWESLWRSGAGAELEHWQRDLAKTTPFWDFSGYNPTTTAAIAPTMPYMDPAHYLPPIGERMLQRVYGAGAPGFGERVDAKNIEAHLLRLEAARTAWQAQNPALARRLNEL